MEWKRVSGLSVGEDATDEAILCFAWRCVVGGWRFGGMFLFLWSDHLRSTPRLVTILATEAQRCYDLSSAAASKEPTRRKAWLQPLQQGGMRAGI